MTQPAPQETVQLLAAADAHLGVDGTAFSLTLQAAVAAAQVSPELARPYVARLWFTPWRLRGGRTAEEREERWTARMDRTRYELEGQVLTGLEVGRGPAVLLVHGWGDSAARVAPLAEQIAAGGFRVIAPDLPGHGGNPPRETDLPEWSRVVEELARSAQVRAVVAHSLGGVAAARTALTVDLDALVLLAPAVRLLHVVQSFQGMFALPDAAMTGLRLDIEARFGPGVWRDWEVDRFALPQALPVLLVHSDDDEQIPVDDGRLLAQALPPRGRYVELTGLGHTRLLRDEQVGDRVVRFLTEHRSDPR